MTDTVRWGFLTTGKIARTVAADLALVPGAELAAVGARAASSAEGFARTWAEEHDRPLPRAHGSYADLVADPDVDVVYVASPHAFHLEHALLAFGAGKHVLCEKPLTLDVAQAEQMVEAARRHDRFLMEAMWTACHPVVVDVADRLRAGEFGRPRHLRADLGFVVQAEASDRMLDPALGASALLDMGIYPLTLAHLMLGQVESVQALGDLTEAGIDADVAMVGRYPGGALATMVASMTSWSARSAEITTDAGRIVFEGQMHHPDAAWFHPVRRAGVHDRVVHEEPRRLTASEAVIGRGYGNEILEVQRCLAAGRRESPRVPHEQTLSLMRTMDDVRTQLGVRFPGVG